MKIALSVDAAMGDAPALQFAFVEALNGLLVHFFTDNSGHNEAVSTVEFLVCEWN